jgi:hypothetical protein
VSRSCGSGTPVAAASARSTSPTFFVCSRTMAMLMVSWFSTSTLPLRSSSTPRGAGSGRRRC